MTLWAVLDIMRVKLIAVDSVIPNLALMKVAKWHKLHHDKVGFDIEDPDKVYISCVFKKNHDLAEAIAKEYPNAIVDIGGSGYDLDTRLPAGWDLLEPDYEIYPACDYDLGFTTRGCNRACYFCIVPRKEGNFHIVQHPKDFHSPNHKCVVLMDNNILFDKDWFFDITDWMIENKLKVDFNQGLDIRLIDDEVAQRLHELKP